MKPFRRTFTPITVVLTLLMLAGCGEGLDRDASTRSWEKVSPDSLDGRSRTLYDRAERARQDLAGTLFGRLSGVLSEQGPVAAIEVCNVEAQGMTREIGREHDVAIGRTSFRLRNPRNQPPPWAKKFNLVQDRVDRQVVLRKGSDRLAVFTPIPLAPQCATCHGPRNQIPEAVRNELEERYPRDEATGFKPGELRGWFWVEAPPSKRTRS